MPNEVTVAIAHYGAWGYLRKTLASVKAQTVPVDIILIDDFSPQWKAELASPVDPWDDLLDGVTFIHTPRKLGWGPTLNLGFQYAQTPWVVPLNGDDLLAPNMVEECLKQRHRDCGAVIPQPGKLDDSIFESNSLPYCAMIGKNLWEELHGYIYGPFSDWDFWCRWQSYPRWKGHSVFCFEAAFTEQSLFTWVDRPGSETRRLGASGELNQLVTEFKEKWAKERGK